MLYTKVLDEYKIDYEEYLREREVDFFGMKDRYLKYIQTKGIDHFTFKPILLPTQVIYILSDIALMHTGSISLYH